MPELPEAETVARQLSRYLSGKTITRVAVFAKRLREPLDLASLARVTVGNKVEGTRRRGKFIFVDVGGGGTVLLHLGMSGTCRVCPPGTPRGRHEHVVFDLDSGESWRYVDPRRFGMVTASPVREGAWLPAGLQTMGPEPLGDDFTATDLFARTRRRTTPIKQLLLDQRTVAGIGNIYASEILFRARIRPSRQAGSLSRASCQRVVDESRAVLTEAVAMGGTTIDSHTNVDGSMGRFVQKLRVYGRAGEACVVCDGSVKRQVHGGRSTFYCSRCQH